MNHAFVEKHKILSGLSPSADVIAGGVASDVVLARNFKKIVFLLSLKTSGSNTGRGTVTINATAANNTSSPTAVPFKYSKLIAGQEGPGDLTAASAAGVATAANEDATYIIEVDPRDLPDAKPYVHLASTEDVNDPLIGSCLVLGCCPTYGPPFPNVLS